MFYIKDDVYISMLKRGIKDFAYRVYDRELVVLEGDWLNGEYEILSLGFQMDALPKLNLTWQLGHEKVLQYRSTTRIGRDAYAYLFQTCL